MTTQNAQDKMAAAGCKHANKISYTEDGKHYTACRDCGKIEPFAAAAAPEAPRKSYPLADGKYREENKGKVAIKTGEFRPPKRGEWYLSGSMTKR